MWENLSLLFSVWHDCLFVVDQLIGFNQEEFAHLKSCLGVEGYTSGL